MSIGDLAAPVSLDPAEGTAGTDYPYLYMLYDRLIGLKPGTLDLEPMLATSWGFTGPKKLSFELKLRHGVKFQDGTPVDANAVKASIDRYNALGIQTDLADIKSISVNGQYALTIHLKSPLSILPALLADRGGMIVSPTAAKKYGKSFGAHPVGAGPFSFTGEVANSSVSLKRFGGYWNAKAIHAPAASFKIYANATAETSALRSGQINFALSVPSSDVAPLKKTSNIKVNVGPSLEVEHLQFNTALAPMDNTLVRQAFNYALDRKAINKILGNGYSKVAWQILPPDNPGYNSKIVPTYPYDPAKAKKLLSQAGFPNGVNLTCDQYAGLGYETIGPVIVANEAAVGIHVKVVKLANAKIYQNFFERKTVPCRMVAWSGRPDASLTYDENFASDAYYNPSKQSMGVDSLLSQVNSTYDPSARNVLYQKMAAIVAKKAPFAELATVPDIVAYSSSITGYQESAQGKDDLSKVYVK